MHFLAQVIARRTIVVRHTRDQYTIALACTFEICGLNPSNASLCCLIAHACAANAELLIAYSRWREVSGRRVLLQSTAGKGLL